MLAQPLHVGQQMLGGVAAHVRGGITRVWDTASAAALIEQHRSIAVRIEGLAHSRRAPRSRPAVDRQGRLAIRVSAGLPVHAIAVTNFQHPLVIRLDGRVQLDHALILRVTRADVDQR